MGRRATSDTLLRAMAETFPGSQILAAFGQTEMSPVTCMLLADDAIRKLGSVGQVIPTVSARVVDENMDDVPVGEVGEIVYRAPTLMAGYWNNPRPPPRRSPAVGSTQGISCVRTRKATSGSSTARRT